MVFTSHAVTHPNILPSQRSSKLHSSPSQQLRMLPYHSVVSKRFRRPCCQAQQGRRHFHHTASTSPEDAPLLMENGWWTRKDLNLRPPCYQHGALLITELRVHIFNIFPFRNHRIHNFGTMLSPYTFSAHIALYPKIHRVVSYYALFKGWLLLSQPPTCLRQNTSFNT